MLTLTQILLVDHAIYDSLATHFPAAPVNYDRLRPGMINSMDVP